MMNLIFVALILQLGISSGQFNFGDIISVERRLSCPCPIPLYKHYAIFVGNEQMVHREPGQNIFHFSGPNKWQSDCVFGRLEDDPGTFERDNYLDGPDVVIDREQIIQRILEKHHNCGDYRLATNNCEHLATYVRYGVAHLNQHGTWARFPAVCIRMFRVGRGAKKLYPVEAVAVSCDELCPVKGRRKSG